MLNIQNIRERLLVLLFLYNKNIKINLPITDKEVAVYGKNFICSEDCGSSTEDCGSSTEDCSRLQAKRCFSFHNIFYFFKLKIFYIIIN